MVTWNSWWPSLGWTPLDSCPTCEYPATGLILATHQLLSSSSTHSLPSPRYLSYLSPSNQLFLLTAHQVPGISATYQLLTSCSYSPLNKSQVPQPLVSCSAAVLLTAYQVSGSSATYQLLTRCSTHSSPSPRYLSYLSAALQLFFSQLTSSQVPQLLFSCSLLFYSQLTRSQVYQPFKLFYS
jgi:hypothetical protein